jgi:hypothetical protein
MASDVSDRGVTSDMSDISSASDKDVDLDELVCCGIKCLYRSWAGRCESNSFLLLYLVTSTQGEV